MKRAPGQYSGLTVLQAELLSYLRHRDAAGNTPTFNEIQTELGMTSRGNVHRLLGVLEDRGYIRRQPNRARAIMVFDVAEPAAAMATDSELRRVPLAAILRELTRRGLHVSTAGHPSA
ncbi:MAG TPA: MarR family transcriptional regulator [Sphingomicrobium sp.]|jgi:repressor LexA